MSEEFKSCKGCNYAYIVNHKTNDFICELYNGTYFSMGMPPDEHERCGMYREKVKLEQPDRRHKHDRQCKQP